MRSWEVTRMVKVGCCWLYAISKYGYPPSIADTMQALKDMKALGFKYVELEGVREENLRKSTNTDTNSKPYAMIWA